MLQLTDDIFCFLRNSGIDARRCECDGVEILKVSCNGSEKVIFPISIKAGTASEAHAAACDAQAVIAGLTDSGAYPLIITEDRWHRQRAMMQARLLAHLERFSPVFARKCEVRRVDKVTADAFLQENHSYGSAACRYRYGLFLKGEDKLVAVATFSNARKWQKGDRTIRSYEWTRYASLPDARVSGGMGRLLKAFVKDVEPDDIMSYADLEWSEGGVYEQLGFTLEGQKGPVVFVVDRQWQRAPLRAEGEGISGPDGSEGLFYENFGSNKYRLKLTEYR